MTRYSPRKTAKSLLDRYLAEISVTPLLKVEEERILGMRAQQGDTDALRKLIEANLRFVVKVAKRYAGCGVPIQDLINEGNLGLIEAARRFDPGRKVRFISYAVFWIRRAIQVAISAIGHPMKVPVRTSILLRKINLVVAQKMKDHGRYPTAGEISDELGIEADRIEAALEMARHSVSLSAPANGPGDMPLETLVTAEDKTEENLLRREVRTQVRKALDDLGHKEGFILRMRFGMEGEPPQTLKEIGDRLGLSRERVRQMQQKALEKLRYHRKTQAIVRSACHPAQIG